MDKLQKIAVLYGGVSGEREVSLMSGAGVHAALLESGLNATLIDTRDVPLQRLKDEGYTCAFIALHGRFGEDGTVQGALELLGIPYTGSGVLASSLALDKTLTKQVWLQNGLSTPRYAQIKTLSAAKAAADKLGFPLAVKPAKEGSSLGFSKVENAAQVEAAFLKAQACQPEVLLEQFIAGREVTVALLEKQGVTKALPIVEIIVPNGLYDYENKYLSTTTQRLCPADLSDALTQKIQALAVAAFDALGCRGCARADVMIDANGQPYLLEINTSPGMTPRSTVPIAARAAGLSYAQLCKTLVEQAQC